jgi:hypothetical protein
MGCKSPEIALPVLTTLKVAARRVTISNDFRLHPDENSGPMASHRTIFSRTSNQDIRTLADEVSSAGVFRV